MTGERLGRHPGYVDLRSSGGRELTDLISRRGKPHMIVSDQTEFTSNALLAWSRDHRVAGRYIAPGKPMQNGYVESFNGAHTR